ncbi:MAG TPA: alcohol dehydrogenase catalytic domain-containing protein [Polyangiaceae bacterium]|jgi:D-arabinose 1-dehydrogenase-like Zn-dependent alcohol dehydrogenase|nr:alcohol dehydrogenase catalytic domain-containing protein [Polyangiaceae bacterium]
MHAVVLDRTGGPEALEYRELADPVPGPRDVLVRVGAAGVCGRDLIDRRGGFPGLKLPIILGHEFAGTVVAVGTEVVDLAVGERVANLHRPFCGACARCLEGETPDCTEAWQSFGQTVDGGYAELVVAPRGALVRVPAAIDDVHAAAVGCTAAVALRALRHEARLALGETVLVTGATGGVGTMAIQIAKLAGATVIAGTSSPDDKGDLLRRLGADHVVSTADPRFHEAVGSVARGGVDVVLELTGSATFPGALRSLRQRGRMVIVGNIRTEKLSVNPGGLILRSQSLCGSHGYTARDLADCFALMTEKRLEMVINRVLPLSEASSAHGLLAERMAPGRVVLVPQGLLAFSQNPSSLS